MTVENPLVIERPAKGTLRFRRKRKNDGSSLQGVKMVLENSVKGKIEKNEENIGPCKPKKCFELPELVSKTTDHDYMKKETKRMNLKDDVFSKGVEALHTKYGSELTNDIMKTLGINFPAASNKEEDQDMDKADSTKELEIMALAKKRELQTIISSMSNISDISEPVKNLEMLKTMQIIMDLLKAMPQFSSTFSKCGSDFDENVKSLKCHNAVTQDDGIWKMDTTFSSGTDAKSEFVMRSTVSNVESSAPDTISLVSITSSDSSKSSKWDTLPSNYYWLNNKTSDVECVTTCNLVNASMIKEDNIREMPKSVTNISNSVMNTTLKSPVMSPTCPIDIPKSTPLNATPCIPISFAEEHVNYSTSQTFVSSRSIIESNPLQTSVAPLSSYNISFADHPLLIRSPLECKNTDICSNQSTDKSKLISTTEEHFEDVQSDGKEGKEPELSSSLEKICTSVNDNALMKFITKNDEMPGGSLYAFCNEINNPEKENLDLLDDENANDFQPMIMEESKSPVYEPIVNNGKGSNGTDFNDVSFPNSSVLTSGIYSTEDIVCDNNKIYFNLGSTLKYSDEFGVIRNSVPNLNNNHGEENGCGIGDVQSSWEFDMEEIHAKLKRDVSMFDALTLIDSESINLSASLPSSLGALSVLNGSMGISRGGHVTRETWYQNCVQDFSLQDEDGDTVLHIAIAKEDSRVIEIIQQMNATALDIKNNLGQTPLHIACYVHAVDIIAALIQAGANERIVDANGNSPLHIACDERSVQIFNCLLGCFKNKPDKLKALMDLRNNNGLTPLHIASSKKEHDIVKYLVDHVCCDIDIQDEKSGSTVLVYALMNNDKKLARLLIDKGANMNIPTSSGLYPLNFAAQSGDIELVKELVSRDAEIGIKLPEFPVNHPAAAEMKNVFEKELRKRRRKKKRDEAKMLLLGI